jgi:demethylmenaquinone methyltransferase/2-methoxy-6-polyprenyl-1,4-benzoquinol methylase
LATGEEGDGSEMNTYSLHPESIRRLFNSVAPSYDLLNHLLSFRRDVHWRKMAVRELKGFKGSILDLATGTGDVAIEIVSQKGDRRKVFGLDFSEPMLRRAYRKLQKRRRSQAIFLSLGDALFLPFQKDTFDAVMIAFGLRNIQNKGKALSEMIRVIKEGGKVIILEFTLPQKGFMRKCYSIYFQRIMPCVGGLISGDREAYAYLPESVSHFQSAEDYAELMRRSGLENVQSKKLTFGIASILTGIKKRP